MRGLFWRLIGLIAAVGSCVAIGYFWAASKIVRVEPVTPAGQPVHNLDVISLQIDILSITLAAVGIGLGVIGLFGYQSIRTAAEERAEAVAKDILKDAPERVEATATVKIEQLLPILVQEHMELVAAVEATMADEIAASQDGEPE